MLAVGGKFFFKTLVVFLLNEASFKLFFSISSALITPSPPALVITAILLFSKLSYRDKNLAALNSSSKLSILTIPACRKAVLIISSLLASAPVWDAIAFWDASLFPGLRIISGFTFANSAATFINSFPLVMLSK